METKRMKTNRMLIVGAVALVVIAVAAYNIISGLGATDRETIKVTAAIAKEENITGDYTVSGTLMAAQSATLTSRVSGMVQLVSVGKGDFVQAGDSLIKIDDSDVQLQSGAGGLAKDNVAKYKLSYELSNELFLKNKILFENGAIAQIVYEQSKTTMEQAYIQYQTASAALSEQIAKTSITAPFDGIVVAVTVQEGDIVSQGATLISIIDIHEVVLKGTVPESLVSLIMTEQNVDVIVESTYNKVYQGVVSFISPVSVPAGQIFPIEITIDNKDGELKAGMTASAGIKTHLEKPILAVPAGAVFERDDRQYVNIIVDNKAKLTEVVTGIQNDEFVAILSGLEAGSQVIIENTRLLMDGDQVTLE